MTTCNALATKPIARSMVIWAAPESWGLSAGLILTGQVFLDRSISEHVYYCIYHNENLLWRIGVSRPILARLGSEFYFNVHP